MIAVNLIGISIIAILHLFILRKEKKGQPDYALMASLILFGFLLLADIWVKSDLSALSFIFQSLSAFYLSPALFIYGLLLMDKDHQFRKNWFWLLSVAIVFTIFLLLDFTVLNSYDRDMVRGLYENPPLIYHIFYKGNSIFAILASLWVLWRLKQYRVAIKNFYADLEPIRLGWLSNFLMITIGLHVMTLALFLSYNLKVMEDIDTPFMILNSLIVLSLFYLSYNGIRQYALADLKPDQKGSDQNSPDKDKYSTSSLSDSEMEDLFLTIKQLLEEEHIYHNPELKIQHLADRLNVTSHKVSQTINMKANKPFYDFVNEYRIAHFKNLLIDPENDRFTILALGIDSGFNSKASLNRVFKQQVGLSPREFKQQSA